MSAAHGGNTTIISFAAQHKGLSLMDVVEDYEARARAKAVIDYSYHPIVSDPTPELLNDHLPALIRRGLTSFKIYTTYDLLKVDDYQTLELMALARREGALVMVHAENHDVIRWLTERLLDRGHVAPRYHGISHARIAEGEATARVINLSELADVPVLFVHVSCAQALEAVRTSQTRGLKVFAETCPQYLLLSLEDLDKEGMEGAKFCCSPPPRDRESQDALYGPASRTAPSNWSRPTMRTVPLRRDGQAEGRPQRAVQEDRQRPAGDRNPTAHYVLRGCGRRPHWTFTNSSP